MRFDRPRFAMHQGSARAFGRGPVRVLAAAAPAPAPLFTIGDDVKLFASTFAAGFLFVSVFLA